VEYYKYVANFNYFYKFQIYLACWKHSKCLPHLPGEYILFSEIPEPVAKQIGDAASNIVGDLSRLKRSHEQRRNGAEGEKEEALEDGLADLLEVFSHTFN